MNFKKHKRKGALSELIQVQEYISQVGDDFDKVSISEPDKKLDFETFKQGYIARNPENHNDMWYVSKEYYDKNLEEVEEAKQVPNEPVAKELTYGQKAVGLSFNPSGDDKVAQCKQGFATEIDRMNDLRSSSEFQEQMRLCSIAITELETAQMWAVKALTWRD
jgi:hypothetical protein